MKYALLVSVGLLTACGNTPQNQQTAKATVSAAEGSLAAVGHTILACYKVPACDKLAPKDEITKAYIAAYTAITDAQAVADAGGTPDMTASTGALSALQGLVNALPKS